MIGGTTDRTRIQPCSVCGVEMEHRENFGLTADAPTWWEPRRHTAPCGRPCMGGGVRPHPVDESPGGDGLAHAHRADACGAPGCGGGQHPVSVDLTCARRCGAVAADAAPDAARERGR